jgi:hemerythrin
MGLEWSSSLSVNVAEIDGQHQKLITMMNDLYNAMRTGKGKDAIGPILTSLIEYAGSHFILEEKLMAQHFYPQAAPHKAEHTAFVKKVSDFKKEFDKGTAMLSVELMNFLYDWLKNHIMKTDKAYGPFFNSKGVH